MKSQMQKEITLNELNINQMETVSNCMNKWNIDQIKRNTI